MIALDTSILIDCFCGAQRSAASLRETIQLGERILLPSLVLYEWLRGPRTALELTLQEELFPAAGAIPFGPREAHLAARLYRKVLRPRGREIDLAIAACAMTWGAHLWTLNRKDFRDIPDLFLWPPG